MSQEFQTFLSQLSETNATLDYFTDFEKVKNNVKKISIKLNQLNYLLGKEDLETAIKELYAENPKTFEVLDILLAIRNGNNTKTLNLNLEPVSIEHYFSTPELILEYIEQSGLGDIFKNKDITNLVDYVFGIEVGLDTNARKNRGGKNMSKAVSLMFDKAGVFYKSEISITKFSDIVSLGVDDKRFDFVIKTNIKTYLIEINYYNSSGSKLNEVARSYSEIAPKINQYPAYEFVWITDGKGWLDAKNKLEAAYAIIPSVYNLTSLEQFIEKIKLEGVIEF